MATERPERPTPPRRPVDPEEIKAAARAKAAERKAAAVRIQEEHPEFTVEQINATLMAAEANDETLPEKVRQARLQRAAKIEARIAINRAAGTSARVGGRINGGIR